MMSRPPRIPNWLPWEKRTIYFITVCVESRNPVLANAQAWQICRAVFDKLDEWRILSAIAMPDHLNILAAPARRDVSISDFSKWFKRWFNEAYRTSNHGPLVPEGTATDWRWQEGCFDRLLRSDESLSEKWVYLRQNPVRLSLVEHSEDWPYQFQFNA
jgi:REP element-mobilizing transposase RayT